MLWCCYTLYVSKLKGSKEVHSFLAVMIRCVLDELVSPCMGISDEMDDARIAVHETTILDILSDDLT